MQSEQAYLIFNAIEQEKKNSEIYLGYDIVEWHFSRARYSATCTEAIDFTLFDKTICGLLEIEETLSFDEIGEILGMNIKEDLAQKKYKDNAEYEILKEALISLQEYEMIDSSDIYFSICSLTDIGREYSTKGKKFRIHKDKEFDLYFDNKSHNHHLARSNFEFLEAQEINISDVEIDFDNEQFIKSFAQTQIPNIYDVDKMNSFKDAICQEKHHFIAYLYRTYLVDIVNGNIRTLIVTKQNKFQDYFSDYFLNNKADYDVEKYLNDNFSPSNFSPNDSLIDSLKGFDEKHNILETDNPESETLDIVEDYYQNALFIEVLKFENELNEFIKYSKHEVWLNIVEFNKKDSDRYIDLLEMNREKFFFVNIPNNEMSAEFKSEVDSNKSRFGNVYITLKDNINKFMVAFNDEQDKWNYFIEEPSRIPVFIQNKSCSIEINFVKRLKGKNEELGNEINNLRIEFAKNYVPKIYEEISTFLSDIDLGENHDLKKINEIKLIDSVLDPFKNVDEMRSAFEAISRQKEELLGVLISRREETKIKQKVNRDSPHSKKNKKL